MRFERIRTEAFGRLRELDTGPRPLPGLVVVTGPNEAGKSTFFHLLTTLLYGFYPASRDRNPYAPWDGRDAEGWARVLLSGGERVEVERRLLSSPTARLVRDGVSEDLRNATLPFAEHVSRGVFGQVFALTLSELAGLDEETWARVQDRLLGSMGAEELRPAREVAAELEQEAGALWRPSRRGNQRIRELQEEIRELRSRRRRAAERDSALRDAVGARDRARVRLAEAREERQREQLTVERAQSLIPVRAQLARIADLEREAGPADELEGLPPEPGQVRTRLEERVRTAQARLEALERQMEEPRQALEELGPAEEALLERRQEVAAFLARAGSWSGDRARLRTLEQEVRDLERRLDATAEGLLATPWQEAPRGPLLALSAAELRSAVARLREAREVRRAREAARAAEAAAPAPDGGTLVLAGGTLVVLGLFLAAVAWAADMLLAGIPALAAMAVGAALLLRRGRGGDPEGRDEGAEADRRVEEEARGEVARILRDVPVAGERLAEPDEALATGVERLQELLRDRAEREEALERLQRELERADAEARGLAEALGRGAGLEAEALAAHLEGELRRAERREDAARAAERELSRLEREEERLRREAAEAREEEEALRGRLEELGGGDAAEGARRAERRREARERAAKLREELERSHPDLEELRARIRRAEEAGEEWTRSDEELARSRARLETLTGEIEELAREAERLEQEHRRLGEEETVDAVDSEIATLEEEEARLLRERDRRWVLAHVVREADRRFREEHQPDLLRRAGAHLSDLTGGRYRRMVADDGPGEHRFHLVTRDGGQRVPLAPPLSTGTLEQAYLALRLAIVDHLDEGQERLPLFVDEALVNWDPPRRDRGLQLLGELSETRQIFFFTCHPPVADRLEALGAHRVELGPV